MWITDVDCVDTSGGSFADFRPARGRETKEILTDDGKERTTGGLPARNASPQGSARRASSRFLTRTSRTWTSLLHRETDFPKPIIAEAAVFTTRANGARNARFLFRRLYSLGRIFVLDFRSYGSAATRIRIYGDGRSAGRSDMPGSRDGGPRSSADACSARKHRRIFRLFA